ncbi:hypothetical protein GGX14DRAFT_573590 [Mycena pura]|uniref:alpha-galactosidase n=1 Tax=Mycena pura TaxID=153505 RepID=A0AAD6V2V3_9AGAR|nr:hypothetical protein GGX14DRAFT_573590 [Mycena pura]
MGERLLLMDMLEVGNDDLTHEEAKFHFTVRSFLKSPLLVGTHLADASPETLEILKNTEIIAINQDPVVADAVPPNWTPDARFPAQYWSGESENGTVIMMLNTRDEPAHMFFSLTESPWLRAGRQYFVRVTWTKVLKELRDRHFFATFDFADSLRSQQVFGKLELRTAPVVF